MLYLLVDEAGLDVQGEVACEGNGEQELGQEVVLDHWLHPLQAGQVWVLGGREDSGLLGVARQCGLWTDLVFMCKCLLQLGTHLDTDGSGAAVGWGQGGWGERGRSTTVVSTHCRERSRDSLLLPEC